MRSAWKWWIYLHRNCYQIRSQSKQLFAGFFFLSFCFLEFPNYKNQSFSFFKSSNQEVNLHPKQLEKPWKNVTFFHTGKHHTLPLAESPRQIKTNYKMFGFKYILNISY